MPIHFVDGLPYLSLCPPSDDELDTLPHVMLTSDAQWDPTQFDLRIDDYDEWFAPRDEDLPSENIYGDIRFDTQGNYRGQLAHAHEHASSMDFEDYVDHCLPSVRLAHRAHWRSRPPDLAPLRPFPPPTPPRTPGRNLDGSL